LLLSLCVISRQALTDGFHFSDDVLSSLHSFPLELVSRLRRPTSHCCSVLEPPVEAGQADSEGVDAVEDMLPDKECDSADDESASVDVPMEDCGVTMNSASCRESVDVVDCTMVSFFVIIYKYQPVFSFCITVTLL